MKNINYINRVPTFEEYEELRLSVGWPKTEEETTTIGLNNSLFSVCVTNDEEIVATGRVVGDGGVYFYIQDVIVKPIYQNQGIGRKITESLIRYIQSKARDGAFIGLMSAQGKEEFYKKFGFAVRPNDAPGMYMTITNDS